MLMAACNPPCLRRSPHQPMPLTSAQREEPAPPGLLEEITAKGLFCLLCMVETAVKMAAHATQVGPARGVASVELCELFMGRGWHDAAALGMAQYRTLRSSSYSLGMPCSALSSAAANGSLPSNSSLPMLALAPRPSAQVVRRAGMAGSRLAHTLAAAARPALESAQAAGAACAAALRRGDYHGAAKLAGQHASEAMARLAAAAASVLAAIRDTAHSAATRWRTTSPTCCCLPTAAQLGELPQRLLARAQSSAADAGKWASAKWSAVDPAGRLPAVWKRACSSRSSTYVLVVVGLGCASLAVGTLLLTLGP